MAATTFRQVLLIFRFRVLSNFYQNGDLFVIVDCGGGTVDLISYAVIGGNPMKFREAVRGEGQFNFSLPIPRKTFQSLRI